MLLPRLRTSRFSPTLAILGEATAFTNSGVSPIVDLEINKSGIDGTDRMLLVRLTQFPFEGNGQEFLTSFSKLMKV